MQLQMMVEDFSIPFAVMVLDALVDANFQEADEDPYDDEDYERRTAAKLFLFKIATALTNGYRNKDQG